MHKELQRCFIQEKKSNSVYMYTYIHTHTIYILKKYVVKNLLLALCCFLKLSSGVYVLAVKKKFYELIKEYFFSFFFLDVKSTIWVKY